MSYNRFGKVENLGKESQKIQVEKKNVHCTAILVVILEYGQHNSKRLYVSQQIWIGYKFGQRVPKYSGGEQKSGLHGCLSSNFFMTNVTM